MACQVFLGTWCCDLLERRAFLRRLGGGALASLFAGNLAGGALPLTDEQIWRLIDAVQRHLLPDEAAAPGARELRALAYLQWVLADPNLDPDDRVFILQGAARLDALAREDAPGGFETLDAASREAVLRRVARTPAGEHWLSTLLLYLLEALLVDPVYGANPDGIGWRWLGHQPGFPRPVPGKRYGDPV